MVRWQTDVGQSDVAQVGDTEAFLGELGRLGLNTPPGFCITADAYREMLTSSELAPRISARLSATEMDDPVDLESAAEEIRSWIEQIRPSSLLHESILAALGSLGAPAPALYAVRVSRVGQDVSDPRSSGLEQAYLALDGSKGVIDHVAKCWATPWTSRAIYYRHRKKIPADQVAVAVLVQPMQAAQVAGVLFTADPLTGARLVHIDATWGLGEAINSARWKPDHFVVDDSNASAPEIRDRSIEVKTVMQVAAPEGGLAYVAVPLAEQTLPCLDDAQVLALAALGRRVQAHFGYPQDIEWCIAAGRIVLLQTRALAV